MVYYYYYYYYKYGLISSQYTYECLKLSYLQQGNFALHLQYIISSGFDEQLYLSNIKLFCHIKIFKFSSAIWLQKKQCRPT